MFFDGTSADSTDEELARSPPATRRSSSSARTRRRRMTSRPATGSSPGHTALRRPPGASRAVGPCGRGRRRRPGGDRPAPGPRRPHHAVRRRRAADQGPSLYKHVAGKRDIEIELIADALAEMGEVLHRAVTEAPPGAARRDLLAAYRAQALAEPDLYRLTMRADVPRPPAASRPRGVGGEPFRLRHGRRLPGARRCSPSPTAWSPSRSTAASSTASQLDTTRPRAPPPSSALTPTARPSVGPVQASSSQPPAPRAATVASPNSATHTDPAPGEPGEDVGVGRRARAGTRRWRPQLGHRPHGPEQQEPRHGIGQRRLHVLGGGAATPRRPRRRSRAGTGRRTAVPHHDEHRRRARPPRPTASRSPGRARGGPPPRGRPATG